MWPPRPKPAPSSNEWPKLFSRWPGLASGSTQPGGAPKPGAGQVVLRSRMGRLVLVTTVLGSAVAMLTSTVVNVALPTLATDLGASTAQQQWLINAYTLTLASLILVGGSLGDRYGRLRMYRLGAIWFGLASATCALAPSVGWLIAARLLQGVGGALLTPGSLAIIEATLAKADRAAGVGAWSGLGGVAAAAGPLIGGFIIDVGGWRWVFVLNLPLVFVVLMLSRVLPESSSPADRGRLDIGGVILSSLLLGALSFAFIGAGDGLDARESLAFAIAGVALVGLLALERSHPAPILPLSLFAHRRFVAANVITLVLYGGMAIVFFLVTVNLQVVGGYSATEAGASMLPVTVLMLTLSARGGALAARIGFRVPLTVGPLVIATGMVILSRIGPDPIWARDVAPGAIVFGLGLALTVAPVTSAALGAVPGTMAGAASGFNNAVARTGGLLAVAGIPPAAGLIGDGLSDPALLSDAYGPAVRIGAALVAVAGVLAFTLLRHDR